MYCVIKQKITCSHTYIMGETSLIIFKILSLTVNHNIICWFTYIDHRLVKMDFFSNYCTNLFGKWWAGTVACMWRAEDDLQRSVCSFESMWVLGAQVVTTGGKSLYPLCHLTGPKLGTLAHHQIPLYFKSHPPLRSGELVTWGEFWIIHLCGKGLMVLMDLLKKFFFLS